MTRDELLTTLRALPSVLEVMVSEPENAVVVVSLRAEPAFTAAPAAVAQWRADAAVIVSPYVRRVGDTVDPAWLAWRLGRGTSLPDQPEREPAIKTERLLLRRWSTADLPAMWRLHSDPETMAMVGGPVPRREFVDREVEWADGRFHHPPLGHYAVVRATDGAVMGWTGLAPLDVGVDLGTDVQIGWRFHRSFWGQGFATEAAAAVLADARAHGVTRVVAITSLANERSQAVMERVGMTRLSGVEFDHPRMPPGDPNTRHCAYASDGP